MTLLAPFLLHARSTPERPAIIEPGGKRIAFGALAALSAERARAFAARGIKAGDRVLIAIHLCIELYASLAGLWRLGAVPVFPEPSLGLGGVRHAASLAQPKALLAGLLFRALAVALPELRAIPRWLMPAMSEPRGHEPLTTCTPEHPALISFTSGSTGAPKGMLRTHGVLMAQQAALTPLLAADGDNEIALVGFPVFVLAHLALGITSVLPPQRARRGSQTDVAALTELSKKEHVTRLLLAPRLCEALVDQGLLVRLRTVITGGGPVFPDLIQRLQTLLPQADIVAVYGSTEVEPIAVLHARDVAQEDWQAMANGAGILAGQPVPEATIRIVDDEILVAGPHVVHDYLGSPSITAATKVTLDGRVWHRTGDAGRMDCQGRLWLLGRLAARAGNLFPFGVEAAARRWPGLRRAALVPVEGRAVLFAEGESERLPEWQRAATAFGAIEVVPLGRIPLDARHQSKVDYAALRKMLGSSRSRTT